MMKLFRHKRRQYYAQDRQALRTAARYGLTQEYKDARREGLSPQEALEEWDLGEM
ncbi:MAG: hypothetical protein IJQ76_08120 [Prevotella sp.]|nr:hypothetical protein [Prevotella sp.]